MAARFKTFQINAPIHNVPLSAWQGRTRPNKTRDWENKGEARKNERNGKWPGLSSGLAKLMDTEIRSRQSYRCIREAPYGFGMRDILVKINGIRDILGKEFMRYGVLISK